MMPDRLPSLIDRHAAAPEREPGDGPLAAVLRPVDAEAIDPTRLERVIAQTLAAARRTPQRPPSPAARLLSWLAGLSAMPEDGLWRFGLPVTAALLFGVLAGHATLDQAAPADTPVSLETLITSSHPQEPFGL